MTSSAWKNLERRGMGRIIFPCDSCDLGVNGPPVGTAGAARLLEPVVVENIAVVGLKVMEMYGVVEVVLGGGDGGIGGEVVVVSQLKTLEDFYAQNQRLSCEVREDEMGGYVEGDSVVVERVVFWGGGVVGEVHCVRVASVVEDVAHSVVRGDVACWIERSRH